MISSHTNRPVPTQPNYGGVINYALFTGIVASSLLVIKTVANAVANQHLDTFNQYCSFPSDSTFCFAHNAASKLLGGLTAVSDRVGGVAVIAGIIISAKAIHALSNAYDDHHNKIKVCLDHIYNTDSDRQRLAALVRDGKVTTNHNLMTKQDLEFFTSYCKV